MVHPHGRSSFKTPHEPIRSSPLYAMTNMTTITQLNQRFNADGAVRFEAGNGGLTRAVLQAQGAESHVYLHGAHVTHYRPADQRDALFLSRLSHFAPGKPIRGGVPICFPWFSNAHEPAHGYARLEEWEVESAGRRGDDAVELVLRMTASPKKSAHWPHEAQVRFRLRLGAALGMTLEVSNSSDVPITFEEALHTYLAIGDVRQAKLHGLAGTSFLDKGSGGKTTLQEKDPLVFSEYTDRVYLDTRSTCIVDDPAWKRRIEVSKTHSNNTVVWNPWIERAHQMEDFGDDQWPDMLCVETANVGQTAVTLEAGQTHAMGAVVTVTDQ
jgi:glucose-6-phosphate 1-epimerase